MITEAVKTQAVVFRGEQKVIACPCTSVYAALFDLLNSDNGVREAAEKVCAQHKITLNDINGDPIWTPGE